MSEWCKGRAGFVVAVSLVTVMCVSTALWLLPMVSNREPVDFTYHLESSVEEHQLAVDVDLSDGMSIIEAVQVADVLFCNCMGAYSHEVVSANMSEQGVWNVEFVWDGKHWFRAVIDSIDKAIVYDRCK